VGLAIGAFDGSIARAAREIAASARTNEAAGLTRVAVCVGGPVRVWQGARRRQRSGRGDRFDRPQRATGRENEGRDGGVVQNRGTASVGACG
jgi:hypothetical protein